MISDREKKLLLLCADHPLPERHLDRIHQILMKGIDWSRILLLSHRHGMKPLLLQALQSVDATRVSLKTMEELQQDVEKIARKNRHLITEMVRLSEILQDGSLEYLALKGPIMTQRLYGDTKFKRSGDLDILIRKRDFAKARELFQSEGFEARHALTRRQEEDLQRSEHARVFVRQPQDGEEKIILDLHWQVVEPFLPYQPRMDDLLERKTTVRISGRPIFVPCPEDQVNILVAHGSKHCWKRLIWLCDLAQAMKDTDTLDWDRVDEEASRHDCRRLLLTGLYLVRQLGAKPPRLSVPPDQAKKANRLSRIISKNAVSENNWPSGPAAFSFHFQALDSLRAKLRFLWKRSLFVVTPKIPDWSIASFPIPFHSLYYFLRPVRILWKHTVRNFRAKSSKTGRD